MLKPLKQQVDCTLAAPAKPPGLMPSIMPVFQGKGQNARLRKRRISTRASLVQVLSMEPSGCRTMRRVIAGSACAAGSLQQPDTHVLPEAGRARQAKLAEPERVGSLQPH